MDWSIYSNYRLIYKLDGVHRLIHSWDRRTVDVHGNSASNAKLYKPFCTSVVSCVLASSYSRTRARACMDTSDQSMRQRKDWVDRTHPIPKSLFRQRVSTDRHHMSRCPGSGTARLTLPSSLP